VAIQYTHKRIQLVFCVRIITEDSHCVLDMGLDPPIERKTSLHRWVWDLENFWLADLFGAVIYLQFYIRLFFLTMVGLLAVA